ncbi:MAG: TonB-dependent receptor, partial [Pseudomonadota bacterium]
GAMEEIVVLGQASTGIDTAPGPAATFNTFELERTVAFNRDIVDVYGVDPRLNLDNEDGGFEINCVGKNPRFNSVTLDGVSQNDRFGLNSNGYSTAVGQPFPFDALAQVAVELAPFDVTYGGFSACNINSVTRQGSNEFSGNAFWEITTESLRGDQLGGTDEDFSTDDFREDRRGFTFGGPIIEDRLFFFTAYEDNERPRFLAQGFNGSGNGQERPWFSQSDFNRINDIANNLYGYDPGGEPTDGAVEFEKYLVRLDWTINDNHNLAVIYNYFDGFEDRASDGDDNEFEFSNHFYTKGAESENTSLILSSQWTDAFSTQLFYSDFFLDDSQITVGPPEFGDHQIEIDGNTVYLGADDSRQANGLGYDSTFIKATGQLLVADHVLTFGYEQETVDVFNLFVQHARGGEYDYFDDSENNPAFCAALSAQGRFDDPACGLSGIDKFELGRPSRIYYGSGGGTNNPLDAAADYEYTQQSLYLQDEFFVDSLGLTVTAGLRYENFKSDDRPTFNPTFTAANGGLRNDANIDGVDILMPRLGFNWEYSQDLTLRGGAGLFSGGNPFVWISNSYSNDGLTNVQLQLRNFDGARTIFGGAGIDPTTVIPLVGPNPGASTPQELFDQVGAVTSNDANDSNLALVDPDYEQPAEWKLALGATYDTPWWGIQADVDFLYTRAENPAFYVDLSQEIVGNTRAGAPIYGYVDGRGEDNLMLTNSDENPESTSLSLVLRKEWDNGFDLLLGYAYTQAEDVSPMTSSTAGSNFSNTALLDINNPGVGPSNYVVPHRLTLRALYTANIFGDYQTRFALNAFAQEGQPQSYVMDTTGLEGNRSRRHLLYVPTGVNDPNVVFAMSPEDQAAFFNFVSREGLAQGQFVGRNSTHARWTNRMDLRIDQEIPTFIDGVTGTAFLKIYNLGNFLNKDWGKVYDAQFFSIDVVDADINDDGQYVYTDFTDRPLTNLIENRSLWSIRMGLEVRF